MSLLSKAWKSVRSVAAPLIGTAIGGPIGGAIGVALAGSSGARSMSISPTYQSAGLPALGALGGTLGRLTLPGVGAVAGAVGGAVVRGAGSAMRGAIALCRKHPQWCSTIGGTAAVAAMMESGQIPVPKKRRSRGITGREFRAFRRVHHVLSGFCAPRMHIRKRSSKSCR